ncbi:MAG TPA: tetratricopeptide repeat protein [Longimicrobium sp.]|nr:tetratricopeptide repeat protein [Longimicrobium sp.]
MADAPSENSRRFPRRWVVPPGLPSADEPFEGWYLLDEQRTPLGLLFWQTLRDVEMWTLVAPDARGRLFAPGSHGRRRERIQALDLAPALRLPLEQLARVLDPRHPPGPEQLTEACQAVSRWASDNALPRTALAFAQSAAMATPDRPAPAFQVGLLARRSAQYRRAETWFRRALALARRARDWNFYGLACMGVGNLHRQRGDYPAARGWFVKALRVARRHGLWQVRPLAMHDLFCVAANAGNVEEAEAFARRAFRAYGRRHPRLVALAHDVARFWLLRGDYDHALQVFRAVLPHLTRVPERRLAASNMARAAAAVGDRMTFAAMWSETWRMVDDYDDSESVPEALLSLAQGAAVLGDRDRGVVAANQALQVARERNESEQRLEAEALLEQLRRSRPVTPAAPAEAGPETHPLAMELIEALNTDFAEPLDPV